jgi:chloride channel protein, CIC family
MTKWALRFLLLPAFIGAITGLIVGCIGWLIEDKFLDVLARQHTLWLAFLPFLIFPFTYLAVKYTFGLGKEPTAEIYINAYHSADKQLPLREIPGRMFAAIVTVVCGGSQGLESPSNLIGAGIGCKTEQYFKSLFDTNKYNGLLMTAGASAGIAAIFSSPFVGAFYGLEVPYRNGINTRFLIPVFVAAICSYFTDWLVRGARPLVLENPNGWIDGKEVFAAFGVAILCGLGARLFCIVNDWGKEIVKKQSKIARQTIAGCGVVIIALLSFFIIGQWVSFGPGHIASKWAFTTSPSTYLILLVFFLHTIGTLFCVYGGAAGGVFTSLALAGTLIGLFVGTALGYPQGGLLPLIGAGCFLGAGYRIPFAGLALIVTQSFNFFSFLIGMLAVALAYYTVGQRTVAPASK